MLDSTYIQIKNMYAQSMLSTVPFKLSSSFSSFPIKIDEFFSSLHQFPFLQADDDQM